MKSHLGIKTRAVHAGQCPDPGYGGAAAPIIQSSTFIYDSAEDAAARFAGEKDGFIYTRWGNPTNEMFEMKLAELEGMDSALAVGSGMAAISTTILGSVKAGDHIVACKTLYSGTNTFLTKRAPGFGIEVSFVDPSDIRNFEQAIQPNTKLIYLESPGNPTLEIIDLAAAAGLAKSRGIRTVIDNTFATPINQRPGEFGIDVVLHSATKYLGGHGDLIGGVITASQEIIDELWPTFIELGATLSPFHSFLLVRGMQTLPIRMAEHNGNAQKLAEFLESHSQVNRVFYPGLPSFPGHEIARKQMSGFGGVVCLEVADVEKGRRVMNAVELCSLTVSLGDVKTLISHPASMTHAKVSPEARAAAGITDGLIRIAVGIENVEDLIDDLGRALKA